MALDRKVIFFLKDSAERVRQAKRVEAAQVEGQGALRSFKLLRSSSLFRRFNIISVNLNKT